MLAIGNAIGSNIANIGLVLGITALIRQLPFAPSVLKGELPWLMGTTVIALFCLADFRLDMIDGIILLSGLGYILFRLTRVPLGTPEGFVDTFEEEEPVNLAEVSAKLVALKKEMGETENIIAGFCDELGIKAPF